MVQSVLVQSAVPGRFRRDVIPVPGLSAPCGKLGAQSMTRY
jgi:hypothetical protein